MGQELKEQIAMLRAIAPELNKATDEANAVVRMVEDLLTTELSLGISGEHGHFDVVRETDEDGRKTKTSSQLAFGRVGNSFQIHILRTVCGPDESGDLCEPLATDRIPWSQCSRQTKLQAFSWMPELLSQIAERAQHLVTRAAETSKTVKDVLQAMAPSKAQELLSRAADDSAETSKVLQDGLQTAASRAFTKGTKPAPKSEFRPLGTRRPKPRLEVPEGFN
jgi:hypothetical protein